LRAEPGKEARLIYAIMEIPGQIEGVVERFVTQNAIERDLAPTILCS
jgi:hypothetical protein